MTSIPPKGSEVRRRADGLIGEIYAVDPGKDVLTIRWKAGSRYQTHVCTSEQLAQYWDTVRIGPRRSGALKTFLVLGAIVVLLVIWAGNSSSSNSGPSNSQNESPRAARTQPQPAQSQSQPEEAKPHLTADQLSDAEYLDNKYGISGLSRCEVEADDYLRSIAKYDYAWDKTGFLESKFDHILTHVKTPGVLTLISEKAKLQNGFGAFQHIRLYCDYDTQADKVLDFDFTQ